MNSRNYKSNKNIRAAIVILICLLTVLFFAYFVKGSLNALGNNSEDLRLRWAENIKFLSHLNPSADQQPGPTAAVYPPWGYVLGIPFAPPMAFRIVRYWFWALNCLSILVIGYWASSSIQSRSAALRWLAALSCAAIGGNSNALSLGQYSLIITALLAGAGLSLDRGRLRMAGLLLGFSCIKPQISILFIVGLISRNARRFTRAIVFVAVIVLGASLIVWVWTSTNPLQMLLEAARTASAWRYPDGHSLYDLSRFLKIDLFTWTLICIPFSAGMSFAASRRLRHEPLIDQLGVCSALSMLMFPHSAYDNVALAFLLIALMRRVIATQRLLPLILYLLNGLTLWMPLSFLIHLRGIECLIWALGAIYLFLAQNSIGIKPFANRPADTYPDLTM